MRDSIYDASVYASVQGCHATAYETTIKCERMPDGTVIRLYRDDNGQTRIVAFKSAAHKVGYSGVLLYPYGEVRYKETCPAMRSRGATRLLTAMLTVWGIKWYPSENQTIAGAACYARRMVA